jgi:hypothetical protein
MRYKPVSLIGEDL